MKINSQHQQIELSVEEKMVIETQLKEAKKSFYISNGIAVVILALVFPYLLSAVAGEEYEGNKFLFISIALIAVLIFFGYNFYKTVYPLSLAAIANYKSVVQTAVIRKIKSPTFHPKHYCLVIADSKLDKLYFPQKQYNDFEKGDLIEIHFIEKGNHVLDIKKV